LKPNRLRNTVLNDPILYAEKQLVYDVAIIGGGLFGSATAKYVSEDVEFSILIGPSEEAKETSGIFGAWFDEGRIAELADSDHVWYTVGQPIFYAISFYQKI
jgi:hypothetical protein